MEWLLARQEVHTGETSGQRKKGGGESRLMREMQEDKEEAACMLRDNAD